VRAAACESPESARISIVFMGVCLALEKGEELCPGTRNVVHYLFENALDKLLDPIRCLGVSATLVRAMSAPVAAAPPPSADELLGHLALEGNAM
jgi:hypothetical protein